jgi:rhodanese-related sulfurtransferase
MMLILFALAGVRSLNPPEARVFLENKHNHAVLLDVQSEVDFKESHVQDAVHLPLKQVLSLQAQSDLPLVLQGKTLLVMCKAGLDSLLVVRHLSGLGISAYQVTGGLQEWGRDGPRLGRPSQTFSAGPNALIVDSSGVPGLPYRSLSVWEQLAAAAGLLVIKPLYTLLGVPLIFLLLVHPNADLRLAGWGVAIFWLGELACGINYFLLKDSSVLAEYIHSYSMVLTFAIISYVLLEIIDRDVLHFGPAHKSCRLVGLCGACVRTPTGELSSLDCGLRRLGLAALPAAALLATIPLMTDISASAYNAAVGPIVQFFTRTPIQQVFEARYCPLAAMCLFGLAWVLLIFSRRESMPALVRLLGCAAIGFLFFSFFRVALGLIYDQHLALANFWEEATELLFILGVYYLLWGFRRAFPLSISWLKRF